jgi:hypothetical protein
MHTSCRIAVHAHADDDAKSGDVVHDVCKEILPRGAAEEVGRIAAEQELQLESGRTYNALPHV